MPVEQIVLQGTSFCNINCSYCDLSEESRRTKSKMPLVLISKLLKELIAENLLAPKVVIVWHSGEPLTLPPKYYKEAIDQVLEICQAHAPQISFSFDFQTNATLINDAWCDLFANYSTMINLGVSCDGPPHLHDAFRIDRRNNGTSSRTLQGMDALDARGIKYNIIAVVTGKTLECPEDFLDFFYERRESLTDFHFNILASPMLGSNHLGYSALDRDRFYAFYERVFNWWQKKSDTESDFPIRNLSQTLARIAGYGQSDDISHIQQTSAPLRSLNMDAEGNITTFYAGLEVETEAERYGDGMGLSLGNINTQSLSSMLQSPKLSIMMEDFRQSQQICASECDYYSICPGGFELLQWRAAENGSDTPETVECLIHVKTLTDAALDFIDSVDSRVKLPA